VERGNAGVDVVRTVEDINKKDGATGNANAQSSRPGLCIVCQAHGATDASWMKVTAANLVQELSTIRALLEKCPYVTVHAEHHGCGGDEEGNN